LDLDTLSLALVALAAFGTALFHSVGGFAGGLLLAICLAPIIGVKETVPVTATAMIVSHMTRVWVFRRAVAWHVFRPVFAVAVPGIALGAIVYIALPVGIVAVVLGLFLVAAVPLRRYLAKREFAVGRRGLALAAVPYGLISGTTFGGGMLLAPVLLAAGLAGEPLVATVASLGFGLNVTKTVIFGFSPLLTRELALAGLLVGLCTIPGAYAGRWIVRRTPIRVHIVFVEALILVGAGYFLLRAAQEMSGG